MVESLCKPHHGCLKKVFFSYFNRIKNMYNRVVTGIRNIDGNTNGNHSRSTPRICFKSLPYCVNYE